MEKVKILDKFDVAERNNCSPSKGYKIILGIKEAYCKKYNIDKKIGKELFVAGKISEKIYNEFINC